MRANGRGENKRRKLCKLGHEYVVGHGCPECQRLYRQEYWRIRHATDPSVSERKRLRNNERYHTEPEYRERHKKRQVDRWRNDQLYRERSKALARENKKRYAMDPIYLDRKREAERKRLELVRSDPVRLDAYRERMRLQNHRRRARLRDACSPGVTKEQWEEICASHRNADGDTVCAYCKAACAATIDHVVPVSRGGRDEPSNVVPACKPCNSSKNDRLLSEWNRWRSIAQ